MLFFYELKRQIQSAYKGVIICLLAAALTTAALFIGARELVARQRLFEPFTVGIVDNDQSGAFSLVLDFFEEMAVDSIRLMPIDKADAEAQLKAGAIAAYVEFPERFAADVMSGANNPFKLHGSADQPLQWGVSKLLASGAVSFMSVSQAGIYATLDYALELGVPRSEVNNRLMLSANIVFIKHLLAYRGFFSQRVLYIAGDGEVSEAAYFACLFIVFWCVASGLAFIKTMQGYTPALYARFWQAGYKPAVMQWIRLTGLFCPNLLLVLPLLAFAGVLGIVGREGAADIRGALAWIFLMHSFYIAAFVLALFVSALELLAASLFRNTAACGLFIFTAALLMLFASGGIVPLSMLPPATHGMRFASANYWLAGALTDILGKAPPREVFLQNLSVPLIGAALFFLAASAIERCKGRGI